MATDGMGEAEVPQATATATLTNTNPTWIFFFFVIDAWPPQEEAGDKPPECVLVICLFCLVL